MGENLMHSELAEAGRGWSQGWRGQWTIQDGRKLDAQWISWGRSRKK
jgi:hypothetical protein